MPKIVVGFILVMACIHAQSYQDLLLPQSRHLVVTVLDKDGKPIVEASIDHSNDRRRAHLTDSGGRFELDTRAPIIVVRKAGFQSALVRTQDVTEPRVILEKLRENRPFPVCSNTGQYDSLDGWGASFQFRRIVGVKASRQGQDIDYGIRSYYVDTKQGPKGIRHGSGLLWTSGLPSDLDLWRSVKYDEVTYDVGRLMIIDARGQLPNGTWWRNLGKFGESASYSDLDEETAKTLDKFLDGACLKSSSR
jgi:hypothetical protein